MSDINPNIPVTETTTNPSGKVELQGGEPTTFDELDSLSAGKKQSKIKEPAEDGDKKSKDLTSDDKKTKSEPKKEAKADAKKEKTEASEPEEKPVTRKTYKAKYQDSELDLDEDSIFKHKVGGQEVDVALKDLLSNYSGKTEWDKRFTELDKTRKGTQATEMKLKATQDKIKAIFEEKDPQVRTFRMAELAGVDPVQFRQKFLEENVSMLEKWYGMSDAEKQAEAASFENAYLKNRLETQNRSSEAEKAQRELAQKVATLRATHQISEDEYSQQNDMIQQLAKDGRLDVKEVTPDFVVETIKKDRLFAKAAEEIDRLGLGWTEQTRGGEILKLVENAFSVGLEPSDLPSIISEVYGEKKTQKRVEEKQKERKEFMGSRIAQTPSKPTAEPVTFDDL